MVIECDECDGEGSVECNTCNHHSDCIQCDGRGVLSAYPSPDEEARRCDDCLGIGKKSDADGVALSRERAFSPHYLMLLKTLPGLHFAVNAGSGDTEEASHFIFDGGEGLLMPMRYREATITPASTSRRKRRPRDGWHGKRHRQSSRASFRAGGMTYTKRRRRPCTR